jgi:hypothetical protein
VSHLAKDQSERPFPSTASSTATHRTHRNGTGLSTATHRNPPQGLSQLDLYLAVVAVGAVVVLARTEEIMGKASCCGYVNTAAGRRLR